MQRAKTIKSLADDLHGVYDAVKSDKMDFDKAKVLTGVAGKIISAAKVRLRYKALQVSKSVNKISELE
jgi:hypothetical protein